MNYTRGTSPQRTVYSENGRGGQTQNENVRDGLKRIRKTSRLAEFTSRLRVTSVRRPRSTSTTSTTILTLNVKRTVRKTDAPRATRSRDETVLAARRGVTASRPSDKRPGAYS